MKYYIKLKAIVIFCIFSLLFSQVVLSQDFSSIDSGLIQLENLITDTLRNTEEQQQLLESLRESLNESENIINDYENTIDGQEILLRELQTRLNEMSEIYKTQSHLSARYERSSKFWRTFTLIAIPVTAILSGGFVWAFAN